jgi:hypothetical protein
MAVLAVTFARQPSDCWEYSESHLYLSTRHWHQSSVLTVTFARQPSDCWEYWESRLHLSIGHWHQSTAPQEIGTAEFIVAVLRGERAAVRAIGYLVNVAKLSIVV